jgi:hypothetical protein
VAHVRDGFQVQTNVVRQDGRRGSLLFVRAAVDGVIKEAIIAACLTALMILLPRWRYCRQRSQRSKKRCHA